jgi:hypothetical protein
VLCCAVQLAHACTRASAATDCSAAAFVCCAALSLCLCTGIIKFTIGVGIALGFLNAIILFAIGEVVGAVFMLIFALLNCLWAYWIRNRIPFSATILQISVQVIQQFPAVCHTLSASRSPHMLFRVTLRDVDQSRCVCRPSPCRWCTRRTVSFCCRRLI